MNLGKTARALPTLFKVGFLEAVAYRAELLVWVLSTTMPLIMLALWSAVAREAPVGRFAQSDFVAYFLATFIVRQLTGAWVAWEMNYEVRQGTLAMRLLRPLHPFLTYATENLAALPMRMIVAIPVAAIGLAWVGSGKITKDPVLWLIWCAAMLGGWLITFLANLVIGCLALFIDSSEKFMGIWLAFFFVFSGYLVPIELFPRGVKLLAEWLPFQYQIGFPVQLMTSALGRGDALQMLARQWGWVALLVGLTSLLWRGGLRRFAAYGG
jgi:ABC-2 type transport system permease protein